MIAAGTTASQLQSIFPSKNNLATQSARSLDQRYRRKRKVFKLSFDNNNLSSDFPKDNKLS